jgi:hypothetical protein
MNPPKRMLTGLAYLKFLKEYLELFKPIKKRVKILGPFLL